MLERSIHSTRHCFIEALNQNKQMSDDDLAVIDEFYRWGKNLPSSKLDLIVYLRCPPKVCAERIRKRDRAREHQALSMEYLQQLHDLHDRLFLGDANANRPAPVLVSLCTTLAVYGCFTFSCPLTTKPTIMPFNGHAHDI
ncbi:unnamed protein product [Schistocephalus solidus]|uniref:Deoxynucleoside kinase domain-containing protein n=1 Tax=Schistocephalus solidus TaxID=70667 RepID=A0A3P7DK39_SCHSO|nr:unnamed protein product [Schistocephalus solidus]